MWPLSNKDTPKQFLTLHGDTSMLTQTAERVRASSVRGVSFGPLLAIGAERHEGMLREHLPEARLLLEPFGRNSAAAVIAAALVHRPDDYLLILPADHHIAYPDRLHDAVAAGLDRAEEGHLVTFGIEPSFPATGYGYIELEDGTGRTRKARRFVEKPDEATAAAYLETGRYVWNAGIFLFRADAMIQAFKAHAPEIFAAVTSALPKDPVKSIAERTVTLNPSAFADCPSISVDYAIMEKVSPIFAVPVDMGWSDVGDYKALWELSPRDNDGNATAGAAHLVDTRDSYVRSEGLPIFTAGLSKMIVVANDRHIMVCPMDKAQDVKTLADRASAPSAPLKHVREQARSILYEQFDFWSRAGWDDQHGGFFESVDATGRPLEGAVRRTRVAARQVFSFASAVELGWDRTQVAADIVSKGLDHLLDAARNPSGGWAHLIGPDGRIADHSEDLYDHAFIILAGATAYRILGDSRGLDMALAALSHIEANWTDPEGGGYLEGSADTSERRANPHMHMLEALLALHAGTGDEAHLTRARDIIVLFESTFFEPRYDILREFFLSDWKPAAGERGLLFEPGHHYEWASLLSQFQAVTGRDLSSWRHRLIAKADRDGRSEDSLFCHNAVLATGAVADANKRLWVQLEKLRALRLHPQVTTDEDVALLFDGIRKAYIDPAGQGLLIDELDQDDNPLDKPVPASMLYHLVTAFAPFL